jgi:hypothetical protein
LRKIGKVTPAVLNPIPLMVAETIVNGERPVAVSFTGIVVVDPTITFPNRRFVELTSRSGLPETTVNPELPLN